MKEPFLYELDNIFNKFLEHFTEDVRKILERKAYFAGGCLYCLCNGKTVKDYDLFLTDGTDIETLKNAIKWSCVTKNALTLGKVQVIIKDVGDPHDCVGRFDFAHNMFFYYPYSNYIIPTYNNPNPKIVTNMLVLNEGRARDMESVYWRMEKFIGRGMIAEDGLVEKILKYTTPIKIRLYKEECERTKVKTGES